MSRSRRGLLGAAVAGLAGCLGTVRDPAGSRRLAADGDAGLRLGLVGDVMLGRNVDDRWRNGPADGVWGSAADRLAALDGTVANLECTLSTRGERTPGRGYYFRADPEWAVPALEAGGVAAVSLANNHVLDFGPSALADTVDGLAAAGIGTTGAGADLRAALRPAVVEVSGHTVAVVGFTDQAPAYRAGATEPGTAFASLDPASLRTRLLVDAALREAAAAEPDLLVASLHWGPNWVTEPAPAHGRFARHLIDRGVDVVHGHSAHVVQGVETYRGRPILYDAGDFVDDYVIKPELHNDRSLLFELVVENGAPAALRLHPVEIADEAVHLAGEAAAAWLRDRIRSLSAPFGTTFERDGDGLWVSLGDGSEEGPDGGGKRRDGEG